MYRRLYEGKRMVESRMVCKTCKIGYVGIGSAFKEKNETMVWK